MKNLKRQAKKCSYQHGDFVVSKCQNIKSYASGCQKGTLLKFKKAKQISLLREESYMSDSGCKEETRQKHDQSLKQSILKQAIFNPIRTLINPDKIQKSNSQQKQTFKDFMSKIQKYNQSKIIREPYNHQQPVRPKQIVKQRRYFDSQQLRRVQKVQSPQKLKLLISSSQENFQQSSPLEIHIKKQDDRNFFLIKEENDKSNFLQEKRRKKFIIHQNPDRGLHTRQYRRSKTEQQIKMVLNDQKRNPFFQENTMNFKQNLSKNLNTLQTVDKDSLSNSTVGIKQSIVSHISLKLMQKQNTLDIYGSSLDPNDRNIPIAPLQIKNRSKQKSVGKHRKFFQTKFSKIRIRFGSSLYNKNMSTINYDVQKSNLLRQLQTTCSQNFMSLNSRKQRRETANSTFCQNKIVQAQKAFIQKRRLIPTAGSESRQMLMRMKKNNFVISNQGKRNKKFDSDGNYLSQKGKKQMFNGWEVLNDDAPVNQKIQEFF